MARKKAAAKASSGSVTAARPTVSGRAAQEALVLELHGIIGAALKQYGLSAKEQKNLFAQSQRRSRTKLTSAALLEQIRRLSDLLTTWFEEPPYVDSVGAPRVLKIAGERATFESLARRFLPGVSTADVVALACRTANVGTLPGGRIALYGDAFVKFPRNRDGVLAQSIMHVRQIFDTCLYIDRLLKSAAERSTRQKEPRAQAGIGIYVYFNGSAKRRSIRQVKK